MLSERNNNCAARGIRNIFVLFIIQLFAHAIGFTQNKDTFFFDPFYIDCPDLKNAANYAALKNDAGEIRLFSIVGDRIISFAYEQEKALLEQSLILPSEISAVLGLESVNDFAQRWYLLVHAALSTTDDALYCVWFSGNPDEPPLWSRIDEPAMAGSIQSYKVILGQFDETYVLVHKKEGASLAYVLKRKIIIRDVFRCATDQELIWSDAAQLYDEGMHIFYTVRENSGDGACYVAKANSESIDTIGSIELKRQVSVFTVRESGTSSLLLLGLNAGSAETSTEIYRIDEKQDIARIARFPGVCEWIGARSGYWCCAAFLLDDGTFSIQSFSVDGVDGSEMKLAGDEWLYAGALVDRAALYTESMCFISRKNLQIKIISQNERNGELSEIVSGLQLCESRERLSFSDIGNNKYLLSLSGQCVLRLQKAIGIKTVLHPVRSHDLKVVNPGIFEEYVIQVVGDATAEEGTYRRILLPAEGQGILFIKYAEQGSLE